VSPSADLPLAEIERLLAEDARELARLALRRFREAPSVIERWWAYR
jgi:hypothetical protein